MFAAGLVLGFAIYVDDAVRRDIEEALRLYCQSGHNIYLPVSRPSSFPLMIHTDLLHAGHCSN